jgi:predicted nucleic acid-binding protein
MFAKHVVPSERVDAVKADPTDNPILECAVAAGSEVVVTGDKHLLSLGWFRGVQILTVSAFLTTHRDRGI